MPGFTELPGWMWRRTSRGTRIGAGALLVLIAVAIAVVAPSISASKRERAQQDARAAAAFEASQERAQALAQKPRFGRSDASLRILMLHDLSGAILADARKRVATHELAGPIRSVECERFPRTVGGIPPERDPRVKSGRYYCVAVTAKLVRDAGALGHPYRALMHFDTGRYAFCKVSGRPDPTPNPKVVTPRACGG
jgi:type II secretory pathway pseudopilin PulG